MIEISKSPGVMDYPLLQDLNHETIGRYGIYNPAESKPGIPYPAVYVINKEGVVAWRYLDAERYSRAPNEEIRSALRRISAVK